MLTELTDELAKYVGLPKQGPYNRLDLEGKSWRPRWAVVPGTTGRAHLGMSFGAITGASCRPRQAKLASPPTRYRDRAWVRGSASDLSSRGGFPCA